MDSPTVIYSWNSAGILDTALFNSSIAFEPTLLSGAIKLKRCQLGMRIIQILEMIEMITGISQLISTKQSKPSLG